jgi:polyisoprenoid-binding protein YceI
MKKWNAKNGSIKVFTTREGALSAVGHDLLLNVQRFEIQLDGDEVTATVEADSLEVEGTVNSDGSVKRPGLNRLERGKVEKSIVKEVLSARKHPTIAFEGTFDAEAGRLEGTLSLHGQSGSVACDVEKSESVYEAEFVVHQPSYGIEPYRAFMGALKVEADVTVRVELEA